jgi:hypothetical protein
VPVFITKTYWDKATLIVYTLPITAFVQQSLVVASKNTYPSLDKSRVMNGLMLVTYMQNSY